MVGSSLWSEVGDGPLYVSKTSIVHVLRTKSEREASPWKQLAYAEYVNGSLRLIG